MMNMEVMSAHSETDDPNGEGEGVWSPEIEQAFQEALKLYPPCGRRKHILQEDGGGKMYGRNELIAKYIYEKTNCRRTRKQVSSHIQVLARREARSNASRGGSRGGDTDSVSPASSIAASSIGGTDRILSRPDSATNGYINGSVVPMELSNGNHLNHHHFNQITTTTMNISPANALNAYGFWEDRPIMTRKIRLVEFSAFVEQCKAPSAVTTSGNGAAGNNHTMLSQAAVLAKLAAASGANEFSQTAAAAVAAGGGGGPNGAHLQIPPFTAAATYASGLTSYQMNNSPTVTNNPNLSAQFASATVYSQQQHHHQHHNTNGNHSLHHSNHYNQMNSAHHTNGGNIKAAQNGYSSSSHSATPAGFHRHSYVKIDYRQPSERQANKMEKIDIQEIQDKFPNIGGPEGLFQRSSPDSFFLVKFWADLDFDSEHSSFEDQNSFFGFSSQFETTLPYKEITCSTKACSYGHQVVERVEKVYGTFNSADNTYMYSINRSPMCEFMTQFIKKLRQLPELPLMNRILENFTVLQLVTSEPSSEILLCIAYVFEIASLRQPNRGSHYHVYQLTKN